MKTKTERRTTLAPERNWTTRSGADQNKFVKDKSILRCPVKTKKL